MGDSILFTIMNLCSWFSFCGSVGIDSYAHIFAIPFSYISLSNAIFKTTWIRVFFSACNLGLVVKWQFSTCALIWGIMLCLGINREFLFKVLIICHFLHLGWLEHRSVTEYIIIRRWGYIDFCLDFYYMFHSWDIGALIFKPPHLARNIVQISIRTIFSAIFKLSHLISSPRYAWIQRIISTLNLFGVKFETFWFNLIRYFWLTSYANLTSTLYVMCFDWEFALVILTLKSSMIFILKKHLLFKILYTFYMPCFLLDFQSTWFRSEVTLWAITGV